MLVLTPHTMDDLWLRNRNHLGTLQLLFLAIMQARI